MKTELSKPARRKASYTEQYKQEALALWRGSGHSSFLSPSSLLSQSRCFQQIVNQPQFQHASSTERNGSTPANNYPPPPRYFCSGPGKDERSGGVGGC
jgi:hypothetical protein